MNRTLLTTRFLTIGALALITMLCIFPGTSKADSIVTVDGTTYDITTVTGTFTDNEAAIEATPWWGNQTVADDFANQVGTDLGFPNNIGLGSWGPFFAWTNTQASPAGNFNGEFYDLADLAIADTEQDPNTTFTFAVVATPEPGTLSLLFAGLLGLGLLVGVKR